MTPKYGGPDSGKMENQTKKWFVIYHSEIAVPITVVRVNLLFKPLQFALHFIYQRAQAIE
jgi:hypothetical protein